MNTDSSTPQAPSSENKSSGHQFVVLQPGESILCEIKRHPFGILFMYFWALFTIMAVAILLVIGAPKLADQYTGTNILPYLYVAGGLIAATVVLVLFFASVIYWKNRWIVTDDSITQVSQTSLFSREISQIPMQNIEDVTVDQSGPIQAIFQFGTLKLESAGEKSKFMFVYCPHPNNYARTILEAHEKFIAKHSPGYQLGR